MDPGPRVPRFKVPGPRVSGFRVSGPRVPGVRDSGSRDLGSRDLKSRDQGEVPGGCPRGSLEKPYEPGGNLKNEIETIFFGQINTFFFCWK